MALYTMTKTEIAPVPEADFAILEIKERDDIQRLLRTRVSVISPDDELLVIAEEFGNWDKANRRIDLLAVDKDANLVVIELKRDKEGAHMELQALRYAAMVARMTFDQAVDAYRRFLPAIGSPLDPRDSLLRFLGWPDPEGGTFGQDVRIVLVAADFSQELASTVLWLNERDLDIRCVRLKPYQLNDKVLLNVEQIVPLPEAADYQIQIRQKKQEEREVSQGRRAERILDTLVARGVLCPGTRLKLIRLPRAELSIPDERAKLATFEDTGRQGIKWDYDGQYYSLSLLCRKICEMGGGNIGAGAFRGPDYWGLEGESLSLTERAALSQANALQEAPTAPPPGPATNPALHLSGAASSASAE